LVKTFKHVSVAAVELDPILVDLAKKYFALKDLQGEARLQVHVDDGVKFITNLAKTGTNRCSSLPSLSMVILPELLTITLTCRR